MHTGCRVERFTRCALEDTVTVMMPIEHFRFCPRCGRPSSNLAGSKSTWHCLECGFVYYFNPAIAAAAFIRNPIGQTLFIRRAKDPAKGKLAIPGGFVDIGESAEEAVRREVQEEVNVQITSLRYLCSHTNEYPYKEITYPVLDLFFVAEAAPSTSAAALDGVESYAWLDAEKVAPEEIAFRSIRGALDMYLKQQ
jgi:mutator protein MutT